MCSTVDPELTTELTTEQITKCHMILDSVNVPRSVPAQDGKHSALYNRLIAYIEMQKQAIEPTGSCL